MIKIYPEADTVAGIFGYKTEKELFDAVIEEKEDTRLGAMLAIAIKLQKIGQESTLVLILVLRSITGLELRTPAEVLKYLNDALSDEEVINLGTKIAMTEDERVLSKIKELGEKK